MNMIFHSFPAQRLDLFASCVRLNRLLVGFRTHFKSLHCDAVTATVAKALYRN